MRHLGSLWSTLSPLLDRALELDAAGRATLIASVRAESPTVAHELERLLAHHDRMEATQFLEDSWLKDEAPTSLVGMSVGAYSLVRQIGIGGMGAVWLGRRSDGRFEGQVAIKMVNPAILDRGALDRFSQEGTLLARLAHPHIARLFDAGVTSAGQPFLVLEYIDGTRIDVDAARRCLDVRERLELFLQVADAVAHAHTNLVVHRDLKPSNILVDADGQVKLLDFGIAKLLEPDAAHGAPTITQTAMRALTPQYAAPEQVAGRAVTTATDVYALGVILYELLSGRHPTAEGAAQAADYVRGLLDREPLRLSDAVSSIAADPPAAARVAAERRSGLDRLRRAYRGDLDTILGKALKKAPGERYAAVTALADDVRRYLRNEPLLARPDSTWYRARKFTTRHWLELTAAAVVVVALVAGTAIALLQARESARQRDRALLELQRAQATNDFSSFLLSQATPTGKPISNAELLARGEDLVSRRFARDPSLRVHMLLVLADRYHENQQFTDARRVVQRAYDESRALTDVGLRAEATCALAGQLTEQGEFAKALTDLAAVLPTLTSSPDYADVESSCRVIESMADRMAGEAARAIQSAERALALERRPDATPGHVYEPLVALATANGFGRRFGPAAAQYKEALGVLESQGLGKSRDAAVLLNNWSATLQESGQMLEALPIAARAVQLARAADSENGASLSMLTTYGNALSAVGEDQATADVMNEALAKARVAGSPRRLISVLGTAIAIACERHDLEGGARLLDEAQATLGSTPAAYTTGLVDMAAARVALARGELDRAVTLGQQSVDILEKATPSRTSLLPALLLLARALNERGSFAAALPVVERSRPLAQSRMGDRSHTFPMGQVYLESATARSGLGQEADARADVARALEHLQACVGPRAPTTLRAEALRQRLLASHGSSG